MAILTVPAKRKIEGPWLIGTEELESINDVLEAIGSKLATSLELEINETIRIENEKEHLSEDSIKSKIEEAKARYSFEKNKNKIVLSSINENKLSDKTLSGILRDPKIADFIPRELSVDIEHGINNFFNLKISTASKGKLSYQLKCFDQEIENEIRYEIDKWIDKNRPRRVLQIWSNHSDTLSGLFGFIAFVAAIWLFPTSVDSYKEEAKRKTQELLKNGVNKENQQQAMELILANQTNYTPENYVGTAVANKEMKQRIFIASLVLFIFSIIRPKTTIGIGARKSRLNFYRIWWKLVVVTIPVTFIVSPLVEYIKSKL